MLTASSTPGQPQPPPTIRDKSVRTRPRPPDRHQLLAPVPQVLVCLALGVSHRQPPPAPATTSPPSPCGKSRCRQVRPAPRICSNSVVGAATDGHRLRSEPGRPSADPPERDRERGGPHRRWPPLHRRPPRPCRRRRAPRTSTTRTRPRTAIGATASTRAPPRRRAAMPIRARGGGGLGQRRQRPVRLRRSAGTLAPVRHQPYGSAPHNCPTPSHVSVSGGSMHLPMRHETSGRCGAGWYTAGMMLDKAFASVDQRVTVRFRGQRRGQVTYIPMRFPPTARWPQGGEETTARATGPAAASPSHYGDTSRHRSGVGTPSTFRNGTRCGSSGATTSSRPTSTTSGLRSGPTVARRGRYPTPRSRWCCSRSAGPQDVRPGPRAPRTSRSTGSPLKIRREHWVDET